MAQSIYVAFTETFPDSYKQFGDEFKEFLLQTVLEWMTGNVSLHIITHNTIIYYASSKLYVLHEHHSLS